MSTTVAETILIIDDDATIREYLHFILEEEGYAVLEAENGCRGIELLEHHPVSIIITDLIMPEKEGIETIGEIKSTYPECRIIAMSGGINRDNYLSITQVLGAHAIIKKPFNRSEALAAIAAVQRPM